jgi:hypothetical protein
VSLENPSAEQEAANRASANQYDFALYVARSFGKALPVLVVIVLIAYGAYYGIGEASRLQTQLNDAQKQQAEAEIKKTQAEADARDAGDKARYEALQEYSKQLTSLNAVSEDVSNRLQALVSTQIDNMKKASDLSDAQDKKSRELQAQIEEKSKAELAALRAQIADAQKKIDESVRAASLSGYNELKANVDDLLKRNLYVTPQVLDLLEEKLADSLVLNQAVSDAGDSMQPWEMRLVLYIQLLRKTSNQQHLENARLLIVQNKELAKGATASLFSTGAFPAQLNPLLIRVMAGLFVDEGLTTEFRDRLVAAPLFLNNSQLALTLGTDLVPKVAHSAGQRLLEITAKSDAAFCYEVGYFLTILKSLSPDAELVFATRALQNPGGHLEGNAFCSIKGYLEKSVAGRTPPSTEMVQQWTGSVSSVSGGR